jgi:AraC-like DNA-binding protein
MDPDGNPIQWRLLQVDRPARLAWMQGISSITGSLCIARIGYDATFDGGRASVALYYASRPGGYPSGCARLLPGGRFVLAGGTGWKEGTFPVEVDNFKAYSTVYIFHTEALLKGGMPLWAILMMALLAGGVAVLAIVLVRRGRRTAEKPAEAEESRLNLMEQLSALIEEKELYRRKNLRITDVASELATNKTYVSVLLNNLSGESFTTMITRYRVQYAQKLLREHPEMLLDEVAESSGFSSRTTFFRSFKALTGQTPQEWRKSRR